MKTKFLTLAILIIAAFSACEKDEIVNSSVSKITKFEFLSPAVEAQIDEENKNITLTVPLGTDYTNLAPTIQVSEFATVNPASAVAQDFTTDIQYTVTAQDGSTTKYTVSVIVKDLISFENFTLEDNSKWYGPADVTPQNENLYGYDVVVYHGDFKTQNASFQNTYNETWASWQGFAYSNQTDMVTAGLLNQFSVYNTTGANSTHTFAIGYTSGAASTITFEKAVNLNNLQITNTTYTYLSMKNGDSFSNAFTDGDFNSLIIKAYTNTSDANPVAETTVSLADFTTGNQLILDTWQEVATPDFTNIKKIEFTQSTSQSGTPLYFCLDEIDCTIIK